MACVFAFLLLAIISSKLCNCVPIIREDSSLEVKLRVRRIDLVKFSSIFWERGSIFNRLGAWELFDDDKTTCTQIKSLSWQKEEWVEIKLSLEELSMVNRVVLVNTGSNVYVGDFHVYLCTDAQFKKNDCLWCGLVVNSGSTDIDVKCTDPRVQNSYYVKLLYR